MTAPTAAHVPHIYRAISQVRKAINSLGVSKDGEANGEGIKFKFRGIDSVLDAFSGPMADADLMIVPSYGPAVIDERPTRSSRTYHAQVVGSYTAVSLIDGSELKLGDFSGEANDTMDKAIAKAQSIALRQAYLQTFCVPLGPDMDPENTLHDMPAERQDAAPQASKQPRSKSEGQAPQETPPPLGGLTVPQVRMVTKKLADKGLGEYPQELTKINDILAWIAQQPAAGNA